MALLKSSLESGDELATKDTTEYAHWHEEGIEGMDPAVVVGGKDLRRESHNGDED